MLRLTAFYVPEPGAQGRETPGLNFESSTLKSDATLLPGFP